MTKAVKLTLALAAAGGLACGILIWKRHSTFAPAPAYVPRAPGTLTFSHDIAPIVFNHCSACHRPGQAAPSSLLDYADVRKHARQIAEVTESRYMPPWLPAPGCGEFVGARSLSEEQIGMIQQWVAEGAAEGNPSTVPSLPAWNDEWQLGKPDLVVTMPAPYTLPAEGRDVYRNFVVPIPLSEDRYVRAVEFNPGNFRIVHHAFIKFDETPESRHEDALDPDPGFPGIHAPTSAQPPEGHFLSWQPGKIHKHAPEGTQWRLAKGSDLVLQVHMQPSGKPEQLQGSVGFYFTNEPPSKNPLKIWLSSYAIDIPAGVSNYVVKDSVTLPASVDLLGILPHAHYLAKDLRGYAILPSGERECLLHIKQWDFNWQGDYLYAKPVFLPKGTQLVMEYTYDNSANNPANPNAPPKRVQYGLQSTDEMAELWLQLLPRQPADRELITRIYQSRVLKDSVAYNEYLLRQNPKDAKAYTGLGKAMIFLNQPEKALQNLHTALELQSDADEAHYYLGLLFRMQKNLGAAETEFLAAVRANPDNSRAHGNLGLIYAEQRRMAEAEEHFRAALRINPKDPVASEFLAEIERSKRR